MYLLTLLSKETYIAFKVHNHVIKTFFNYVVCKNIKIMF